ncbi:MAG: electron transport complex subunit E, partial [Clostridia bacterium]|nr:electron transport complex subunit E [Clostridia bacterium]
MLVKAFTPELDKSLGIFLPLIVVNCVILGRAEMFASRNRVALSALDGVAMGIGYTAALLLMSSIRELLGAGALFEHEFSFITESSVIAPMIIFILPPGGFFVYGMLIALINKVTKKKPIVEEFGCENCPAAATCTMKKEGAQNA